jgi:predicted CopG family antitoxin
VISKEADESLADVINKLYKIRRNQKADDEALNLMLECRDILRDTMSDIICDY